MNDKEMLFYAQAYRTLTKATAEISNNSEDQKRFEIIDWLLNQAEKVERYEKALREIANEQEVGEGDFNADDVANNLIATAKEALEESK